MSKVDRWEPFTPEERANIALALSLLLMDLTYGIVGEAATDEVQAREVPMIVGLAHQISLSMGMEGVDTITQGALAAILDQKAAEAKNRGV